MTDDTMEPLITECPSCRTRFRVTESQLTVASGRVRCGACLNVFRGADHLVLSMDPARTSEDPDAALDALLNELSEVSAKHEPKKTEPPPVPRVVRDGNTRERSVAPAAPPPPMPGGEPRVTVVRDVPRRRVRPPPPIPPALRAAPQPETVASPDDVTEVRPRPPVVEPAAEPIPVMEVREEPVEDTPVEAKQEPTPVEPLPQVEEIVLDELSPKPFAAVDAPPKRETAKVPVDPLGLGDPPFGLEPPAPRRRRWWVLPALLLALLALAGQVLWFQFPAWSVDPKIRPVYEWLCAQLRCELPPMRALDAFHTKDLVVRSHPDRPAALLVDAIIVNEAPFAQPFPELELRFSAIGGNLIAARRFSPREYLAGDAAGLKEIGARTPVHIALEIEDPGGDAVNYLITFR